MDELHRDNSRAALMEQVNWIYRVFKKRKTENELRGIKSRLDWPLQDSRISSFYVLIRTQNVNGTTGQANRGGQREE